MIKTKAGWDVVTLIKKGFRGKFRKLGASGILGHASESVGLGLFNEQPPTMSRSPKSKWHDGQRWINEAGKCIRESAALRTKFRGGVRVQACHAAG